MTHLLQQLDHLLPLVSRWVEEQEAYILQHGVELSPDQQIDAFEVGVKEISKVRLMRVKEIPRPTHPVLRSAAQLANLVSTQTAGISFRYGIFIRADQWQKRRLIVHELTHTMQYERFGSPEAFLRQYLWECLEVGYPFGPLEQEAIQMEKTICG
ncbi:MAG: hypothetical protein AAFR61_20745 [Bacteroidota bacterium]